MHHIKLTRTLKKWALVRCRWRKWVYLGQRQNRRMSNWKYIQMYIYVSRDEICTLKEI